MCVHLDWSVTDRMHTVRLYHAALLLPSGKVLVTGGIGDDFCTSVEWFDPSVGKWTQIEDMQVWRCYHTSSLLMSGKVLVSGGYIQDPGDAHGVNDVLNYVELYDPSTRNWTLTGQLNNERAGHAPIVLLNGKVLVMGGISNSDCLSGAELYDSSASNWTTTGSMHDERSGHTATLLNNGKVLVTGGRCEGLTSTAENAEIYDPSTGTWKVVS